MYNIMPKTVSKVVLTSLSLITLILIVSFAGSDLAKAQNILEQMIGQHQVMFTI
jgi:hypothetical protein